MKLVAMLLKSTAPSPSGCSSYKDSIHHNNELAEVTWIILFIVMKLAIKSQSRTTQLAKFDAVICTKQPLRACDKRRMSIS